MRTPRSMLASRLLVCLGVSVLMFVLQRSLHHRPDPSPVDPAAGGLPEAAVQTQATPDGERLVAWWLASHGGQTPVYLCLNGDGAHLPARAARIAHLRRRGAGLLALSWRGCVGSSGTPSEEGWRTVARAAYDALRARHRARSHRARTASRSAAPSR